MNRFYFRDLLETNSAMLGRMMRFNIGPESNLSDQALDTSLLESIRKDFLLCKAYKKHQRKPIEEDSFWDFKDESERLVFLPAEVLTRLGKLLSACVFGEEISRCLTKNELLQVRDFLGEDIYHYALVRGRYQIGSFRKDCLQMFGGVSLSERCKNFAGGAINTLRSTWPDSLKEKTASLFNAVDLPKISLTGTLNDNLRRSLWELTKKILTREFDQQWTRYFV